MNKEKNPNKEIIPVQAKPIEAAKVEKKNDSAKINNVRIDKISNFTLNVVAKPLKEHYVKHYQKDRIHLIVDIALAAIVLVLLAVIINLWFFSKTKLINLVDFKIYSNPVVLVNGQETEFIIDYTNTTKNELTDVILALKIPASLRNPHNSLPEFDIQTNTINLGNLAAKAHGQFKVKGLLLGNLNDKHEFLAVINYKNQYGQARQEINTQAFQLTDSVLKIEAKLPNKIIANSHFQQKLTIKNTSKLDLDQVKIKWNLPNDFYILNSESAKHLDNGTWLIGQIKADQTASCDFETKNYYPKAGSVDLETEFYVVFDNQEFLFAKVAFPAKIEFSKFNLSFINQEQSKSIAPGGETTYAISYKNNEAYALNMVELGLAVNGDYVDPNYFTKTYNKAKGNEILFGSGTYPELARLEPQAEGSIQIKAGAKSLIDFTEYKENGYQLEARVIASYDDPEQNMRIILESAPIYTQLDSRLSLNSSALFYTNLGDQIGVGSIPPRVGEYTSYWVIIKVINTNNKIKDLKINAQIPAGIEFTNIYNVTDGEQINYNEANRQITWQIANVPAFSGIFNPAPEARIQLALTPTSDQVNQSPALLTNLLATATDEATNAFLSASAKDITIAIFPDESLNKVIE